jgi:hypothetical protein
MNEVHETTSTSFVINGSHSDVFFMGGNFRFHVIIAMNYT